MPFAISSIIGTQPSVRKMTLLGTLDQTRGAGTRANPQSTGTGPIAVFGTLPGIRPAVQ
jgi:hypothetical protein